MLVEIKEHKAARAETEDWSLQVPRQVARAGRLVEEMAAGDQRRVNVSPLLIATMAMR